MWLAECVVWCMEFFFHSDPYVAEADTAQLFGHWCNRIKRFQSLEKRFFFLIYSACLFLIQPFLLSRQLGDGSCFLSIIRTILGLLATNSKEDQNCFKGWDTGTKQTAPKLKLSFLYCRSQPSHVSSSRERKWVQHFGQINSKDCSVMLGCATYSNAAGLMSSVHQCSRFPMWKSDVCTQ